MKHSLYRQWMIRLQLFLAARERQAGKARAGAAA
jgi:hypothetical protein